MDPGRGGQLVVGVGIEKTPKVSDAGPVPAPESGEVAVQTDAGCTHTMQMVSLHRSNAALAALPSPARPGQGIEPH